MKLSRLRAIRRRLQREEGQAAIEFLLILPWLVLFFLLVIDFGILMYDYVSISNAAREGARYGATNCGDGVCTVSEIQGRAVERSGGMLGAGDTGLVTVNWLDGPDAGTTVSDRGDGVVVSIRKPHSFLFFPASIDVVSCSDMRLEQRDRTSGLPSGAGC